MSDKNNSESARMKWMLEENVRLEKLKKELEEERQLMDIQRGLLVRQQKKNSLLSKQLDNQKRLFDKQWQIMENGIRQLAVDKERFEHEKEVYRDKIYREARRNYAPASNVKLLFRGVNDSASLKKRYKELNKIFHPDNTHGDTELIKAINEEYEIQKRYFLGT